MEGISMENINMSKDGDILTIKIDMSKKFGRSKSGKTVIIATTSGNQTPEGFPDAKIGINCYTPN